MVSKGYRVFTIVFLIGILLLINIYLIYTNNQTIKQQKGNQEEAEKVKVNTLHILRNLHLLDLGIRGYALRKNVQFLSSIDSAIIYKDRIFDQLEVSLIRQQYDLNKFQVLKDSVAAYFTFALRMKKLIDEERREEFNTLLDQDRGYAVWLMYKDFSADIYAFENRIVNNSKAHYDQALTNIYLLQLLIFLVVMSTLTYTAFYTSKTFSVSSQLIQSKEENNKILTLQNDLLEKKVLERTYEIQTQNEEIASQNEEIVSHNETLVLQHHEIELQRNILAEQNEKLKAANQIIENQNLVINQKNEALSVEVEKQNQDLRATNSELIEQNNRLQQFTYIISHNLRAPLTRIIGLATIFNYMKGKEETADLLLKIIKASNDLDDVIKDLAFILEIQRLNTQIFSTVNLKAVIDKTIRMLKREIDKTETTIITDFEDTYVFDSLPQYIESIFYNLISNAIKYRDPNRDLIITITPTLEEQLIRIEISDNGLGIDLEKYREKIFVLYKRFHSHVEGRGLGLYLVKTQVGAVGGKIEVASELNKGTTFSLFFKR
jgi:signal transduction histidine kinase/CHASE3 domain sensor protein